MPPPPPWPWSGVGGGRDPAVFGFAGLEPRQHQSQHGPPDRNAAADPAVTRWKCVAAKSANTTTTSSRSSSSNRRRIDGRVFQPPGRKSTWISCDANGSRQEVAGEPAVQRKRENTSRGGLGVVAAVAVAVFQSKYIYLFIFN